MIFVFGHPDMCIRNFNRERGLSAGLMMDCSGKLERGICGNLREAFYQGVL